MSDNDVKNISSFTGTFPVLNLASDKLRAGNVESEAGKKLPQAERPEMERLTKELNIASQAIGRDLRFEVDMESGRSVIQVLNRETGEIIRQIPPEDAKTYVTDMGEVALRLYEGQV